MVVEGGEDLQLRVVVDVPDADVLAVRAVAAVARPGVGMSSRPEQPPARVEHEDLRSLGSGVRRRRHDLDPAVAVQVCGREPADLRRLAAAVRGRRPPGLALQPTTSELVRRHGARVAADHDVGDAVALEIGDHRRGVDPALARPAATQLVSVGVEHERRVERRDDLQPPVSVEVDQARGGEPARLPGVDLPHELRRLHGSSATLGDAGGGGPLHRAARRRDGRRDGWCGRYEAGHQEYPEPTGHVVRRHVSTLCTDRRDECDGENRGTGPAPEVAQRSLCHLIYPEGTTPCCGPFSSSLPSSRSPCSSSARYAAGAASEPTHTSEP